MIRFAIRRPIAVSMLYLAAALLGVAAWRNIPIELLPDTSFPQLTVEASWQGASPETMEAFVTSPLEAAIQQVRGVEKVTSTSAEEQGQGTTTIEVEFARGTDMNFARMDMLERFAAIEDELPPGVVPAIGDYVPDEFREQRMPFLRYTITGPFTTEALRRYADEKIAPDLRQVGGVADVRVFGGRARVLEIRLDEAALAAHGLTPMAVRSAVSALEFVTEAGTVSDGPILRSLAIRQRAGSADDIRDAVLVADGGHVVRVRDVGTVHDTYEDPRSYYRIDGRPAVVFQVMKAVGVNTVAVADSVKAHVADLERSLLPGMRLILDGDESRDIRLQLTDLRSRSVLSALVIFAVLLVFLGSFRSVVIVCATIGFSVLIALNLMYFAGYSLNVLTLMGLAMGFGIMADTAIVVLENIYRRWRGGEPAAVAAEEGAREVELAVVAGVATSLVVFVPFVYLQGELRLYYVPLAVVTALTQAASLLVAFTFIPAVGARLLKGSDQRSAASDQRNGLGPASSGSPEGVTLTADRASLSARPFYVRAYEHVVRGTLRFPWTTVLVATVLVGGSYYLFDKYVARGLVWGGSWGDRRSVLSIQIRQPRGEELARTDEIVRYFEQKLAPLPYVERFTSNVFPQSAQIVVTFPDSVERTDIPVALKEELTAESFGFGGAEVRVTGYGPSFYGGGSSPPNYTIKILGYNYETVREIADGLAARLTRTSSRIRDVDVNASGGYTRDKATEIALTIDRDRLAMHDLTMRDVVNQVRAAVRGASGRGLGTLRIAGEERDFVVKLEGYETFDVLALQELLLPTRSGTGVRLGDIATVAERETLGRVVREDQQYQRNVAYEFRGPAKLGNSVRDAVVAATELPDGYSIEATQAWSFSDEDQRQLYGVLTLSLVLVFMVCAALFESVRQPVCVLLTVPMALIGVFGIFYLTRASFTREAVIGVIMMGGIVVNNSILLVDRVNQLRRERGVPLVEALVQGSLQRVRPILMTSVSTVLGLLPLVLFSEYADQNIWNALGYALIGGLTSSTVLVLTVTPAIYLLLERRAERRRAMPAAAATPEGALVPAGD
ncbi:MAG TPA: efflux RND transporter permease subunit [Gemmatimonadaceae bacterium]|nr:efflux RND transporter permease subunit [Gemmatimonadaceae bacterium]